MAVFWNTTLKISPASFLHNENFFFFFCMTLLANLYSEPCELHIFYVYDFIPCQTEFSLFSKIMGIYAHFCNCDMETSQIFVLYNNVKFYNFFTAHKATFIISVLLTWQSLNFFILFTWQLFTQFGDNMNTFKIDMANFIKFCSIYYGTSNYFYFYE